MNIGPNFKNIIDKMNNPIAKKFIDTTNPSIDYLETKDGDGDNISWLLLTRLDQTPKEERYKRNRQQGKLGRQFSRLFPNESFTPREIELFVKEFKELNTKAAEEAFMLVSGSDIDKYYYYENYEDGDCGTLGNSCMKAEEGFFGIYKDNNNVKMLCLKSTNYPGKIKGRAIVWENCIIDGVEGCTFMDRVYYNYGDDYDLYVAYANEKGWYRKDENRSFRKPDNTSFSLIICPIQNWDFDYYPYMDSLYYISISGKQFRKYGPFTTNSRPNSGRYLECQCTDGDCERNGIDRTGFDLEEARGFITINGQRNTFNVINENSDTTYFKYKVNLNYIDTNYNRQTRDIWFLWNKNRKDSMLDITHEDFYDIRKPGGTPDSLLPKETKIELAKAILEAIKNSWFDESEDDD